MTENALVYKEELVLQRPGWFHSYHSGPAAIEGVIQTLCVCVCVCVCVCACVCVCVHVCVCMCVCVCVCVHVCVCGVCV